MFRNAGTSEGIKLANPTSEIYTTLQYSLIPHLLDITMELFAGLFRKCMRDQSNKRID